MKMLFFLFLTSFLSFITSKSLTFFNGCPSTSIYLQYGEQSTSLTSTSFTITTGISTYISISYSSFYYEIRYSNNTLITSSYLNLINNNLNAISYLQYPSIGCQLFQYNPNDITLSSYSVIIYVNGGLQDKYSYVGDSLQGFVEPKPNTYLQILNKNSTYYSVTQVKFCNTTCAYTLTGSANIPVGSALFFFNYYYSTTSTSSSVVASSTGDTQIEYWCPNCYVPTDDFDLDIDLDDFGENVDPITSGLVAVIVITSLVFCCLCGIGIYVIKKKFFSGGENVPLVQVTETTTKV